MLTHHHILDDRPLAPVEKFICSAAIGLMLLALTILVLV